MQIVFGAAPTRTVFNVESASSKASCVFMVHIGYVIMDVCVVAFVLICCGCVHAHL